jgi:hypothetical protein
MTGMVITQRDVVLMMQAANFRRLDGFAVGDRF